ncbi:hypothetical protein CHU32_21410 [Superficieibacter electus]|uniref:DUF2919 domain-containing protein n=2 Tax=Superficieibacter electus TaxID=2022662 RepID=A0A2P5GJZ6_9ENTR|nr:DUF2919 family protein [Superficieibacter electus]POP42205.1 hypothetical protein CHU33_20525 [Superficieibacter electus]POP44512.1 hypothetical protein CHU32_21410 [Superficieibacter electus]
MKSTKPLLFPSDYDDGGMLKLPWLFWGVLLLQLRTFSSVMHAIAFDGVHFSGGELWIALSPGIPALLVFVLFIRPRQPGPYQCWGLWCTGRWLLILGQCLHLCWPLFSWTQGEPVTVLSALFFIADGVALWWVKTSQRLWACFTAEYGYPIYHYKKRDY